MGFYLRKALRFGRVRINLSRHGVGCSVGVRGARIGRSATGRQCYRLRRLSTMWTRA